MWQDRAPWRSGSTTAPCCTCARPAALRAPLGHDTYDRLPGLRTPTLVLTGDDDRAIPGASSDVLAERIPDARIEVIAGAGHLLFGEQPAETLRLLEAFL